MSNFLQRLKEQAAKPAESQNVPAESILVDRVAKAEVQAPQESAGQTGLRFSFGRKTVQGATPGGQQAVGASVPAVSNPSTESDSTVGQDVPIRAESDNSGPAGFQAQLDKLDALCQSSAGIDPLAHAGIKAHVKGIMVDLIANPEMRGLVLDRDMHNVMKFIQSSADTADTKFAKTAVARVKKQGKASLASNFDAAFDNLMLAAPTLDSVSNMNTDAIKPKVR